MSDFNKGAAMMRDLVISHIIGMQNDIGNDVGDKGYQKTSGTYGVDRGKIRRIL